jgi:hypothetical protein
MQTCCAAATLKPSRHIGARTCSAKSSGTADTAAGSPAAAAQGPTSLPQLVIVLVPPKRVSRFSRGIMRARTSCSKQAAGVERHPSLQAYSLPLRQVEAASLQLLNVKTLLPMQTTA